MKLYSNPVAPNPARVEIYLAEKKSAGCDIPLEKQMMNLPKGDQKTPEFTAMNPLQRAPLLVLDDGSFVAESITIIEYLEELYPEPCLIGRTPEERAHVRSLERIIDLEVVASIGQIVHATNSPLGLPPNPELAERFTLRMDKALGILDDMLADGRPYLMGDAVTIADTTLAAGLQFSRFGGVKLSERFSHLLRWDRDYRARDAMKGVIIR